MWISKIAELAILDAMSDLDVTFRASRVDDEVANPVEHKKYPLMAIVAGSGTKQGNTLKFYDMPCTVELQTLIVDDEKKTILTGLEDEFRSIIDAGIKAEYDAAASDAGETSTLNGLIDIDGGGVEVTDNKIQSITFTMTFKVCMES